MQRLARLAVRLVPSPVAGSRFAAGAAQFRRISTEHDYDGGMGDDSFVNYYNVLGVPPNATPGEIKAAFRKLAKTHHPDAAASSKDADEGKFKLLAEAYRTLHDPESRKEYDEEYSAAASHQHHGRDIKGPFEGSTSEGGIYTAEEAEQAYWQAVVRSKRRLRQDMHDRGTEYRGRREGHEVPTQRETLFLLFEPAVVILCIIGGIALVFSGAGHGNRVVKWLTSSTAEWEAQGKGGQDKLMSAEERQRVVELLGEMGLSTPGSRRQSGSQDK